MLFSLRKGHYAFLNLCLWGIVHLLEVVISGKKTSQENRLIHFKKKKEKK